MNEKISQALESTASWWAAWMIDMSWQVVVVIAVVALLSWLLRKRSATLRYALWMVVLLRLVVPTDFAFPTGWGWWLRPAQQTTVLASNVDHAEEVQVSGQAGRTGNSSHVESEPAAVHSETSSLSWSLLLMLGWLGIVIARLGMLLTAALQIRVWVARARLIADEQLHRLLDDSCRRVGIRRTVRLRNSEACTTPLVVGNWRPVILLPSSVIESLGPDEMKSVLIHELNHVRRWDGVVNVFQAILGTLYFFHPLVWWANRQISRIREEACDELTVASLDRRRPYGEAIVKVAEILGYAAPPLALGVLDSNSTMRQRLNRILDPDLPSGHLGGLFGVVILLVVAAVVIPAGCRPTTVAVTIGGGQLISAKVQPAEKTIDDADVNDVQPKQRVVQHSKKIQRITKRTQNLDEKEESDEKQEPGHDLTKPAVEPPKSDQNLPSTPRLQYRWVAGEEYKYEIRIERTVRKRKRAHIGQVTLKANKKSSDSWKVSIQGHWKSVGLTESTYPMPSSRENHSITMSDDGRLLAFRGESQMPYMLGNLPLLLIESLPPPAQKKWVSTRSVRMLRMIEEESNDRRRPYISVDPFDSSPPSRPPSVQSQEVTVHELVSRSQDSLIVEKEFKRSFGDRISGRSRQTIGGGASTTFGASSGIPVESRLQMTIPSFGISSAADTRIVVSTRLLDPHKAN